MRPDYGVFSAGHFAILAAIPITAAVLAFLARRRPRLARPFRLAFAAVLVVNELVSYADRWMHGWMRFPDALPLQLSDFTLWLTIYTLLRVRKGAFDIAYYLGIAGAGMTSITPELFAPLWSLQSIQFFIAHGGVVAGVLYLVWSGQARPRPGSIRKALTAVLGWACLVGLFNWHYNTNYMFLCRKPAGATPVDFFGPWPYYWFVTLGVAALLFWLLWLPFRRPASHTP